MLRNIIQGWKHHNRRFRYRGIPLDTIDARSVGRYLKHLGRLSRLAVMSCLILLPGQILSGCQGESQPPAADTSHQQDTAPASQPAPTHASSDCSAVVSRQAQTAYAGLAARLAQGKSVAEADFQALCEDTEYAIWLKTLPPSYINWAILRNVMTYVYAGPETEAGEQRRLPKRTELTDNLTYVRDHAADMSLSVDKFESEQLQCRVLDHLQGFLATDQLPANLTFSFLTLLPEIRYLEDHLLVDTGLAIACNPDLLTRLMASVIYRDVAAPSGRQPHENLPGAEALVATYRKLCFEGIASWLEDFANVSFDPDHPLLGKADTGRQNVQLKVMQVFDVMYRYLKMILKDEATLHLKGNLVDDILRGSGGYARTGYVMADLIVQEFGLQRLQDSSHAASAFLKAYQEAAKLVAESTQGAASQPVLEPFPEPEFQQLMQLLREHDA